MQIDHRNHYERMLTGDDVPALSRPDHPWFWVAGYAVVILMIALIFG